MKAVIIYASVHHGNTKKIAGGIAEAVDIDLFDVTQDKNPDLTGYDLIGLASGIFYHGMHEEIKKYIQRTSFMKGQSVFLIATCGVNYRDYTKGVRKILEKKSVPVLGTYQCRGYDTFGPFGKFGGIAKNHPDNKDIKNAQDFVKNMICE